ncbi:hypothetical protein KQ302_08460 [Synechococcus sp. CS-602]|uniref:hypothetical protein n=1 Tax=Synechococcaceae TaxID=1890426 RepID=UPI0008FF32D5|nr:MULTISPECIES: hypothetical protein [Synechococcaceae]MCT4364763.1 hypothetical protein [Candidatus Regnicoccus frigidus MAG-AL1]APD48624.1 hypothetical protein BM449_10760 [Synechococcus sp. SynAce01]MCT0205124.1 hypothetical protein [Synechococcus sp. CS-602]MCT0245775.1 hypothetical protein [Synechococcus sp. CS-601]MCT4367380.1 hypothetical protein [Candidatus Regnicoccus frigidus MAG-AL2]
MSFDSRSLERLQQLGRQLPQPLPAPPAKAKPTGRAAARLHPIESEQDPDQLFRELIRASPDGTVPPHLLQRLQELEGNRQEQQRRERGVAPAAGPAGPAATTKRQGPLRSLRAASGEQQELYSEFHQLLLEGDDD